jgi:tetratricopeptide (TPR) repeat protein
VIAGPYSVQVTGTVFDVQWDPALERFEVSVSKGSVNVFGPLIEPSRSVTAGYKLVAELPQSHLEVGASEGFQVVRSESFLSPSAKAVLPIAEAQGSASVSVLSMANGLSSTAVRNVATTEKPELAWRSLARAGKLKEAFVSAETQGFPGLCESASASDLLILGDAARLAGRPERAVSALMSLRRRFPGDARQAAAAFTLGKVAFDQRHAYAEAAKWFSTSLREQPNGSLSREASGRLIEALKNSGQSEEAERAARNYLAKYPEGPHATIARSLLQ